MTTATAPRLPVEQHMDDLHKVACKFCNGDEAMAKDMVQDTLVKALLHSDKFVGGNLRAWLVRILYNNTMSAYRHRQVQHETPWPAGLDIEWSPKGELELSDEVQKAVDALPQEAQDIFKLALEGMPYGGIATKLNIPMGTVMSRLFRARQTLKRKLGHLDFSPSFNGSARGGDGSSFGRMARPRSEAE
jgi:RNA polymerase sigma-70 factor, ECF subfamily